MSTSRIWLECRSLCPLWNRTPPSLLIPMCSGLGAATSSSPTLSKSAGGPATLMFRSMTSTLRRAPGSTECFPIFLNSPPPFSVRQARLWLLSSAAPSGDVDGRSVETQIVRPGHRTARVDVSSREECAADRDRFRAPSEEAGCSHGRAVVGASRPRLAPRIVCPSRSTARRRREPAYSGCQSIPEPARRVSGFGMEAGRTDWRPDGRTDGLVVPRYPRSTWAGLRRPDSLLPRRCDEWPSHERCDRQVLAARLRLRLQGD